jgi:hypothetical protein
MRKEVINEHRGNLVSGHFSWLSTFDMMTRQDISGGLTCAYMPRLMVSHAYPVKEVRLLF